MSSAPAPAPQVDVTMPNGQTLRGRLYERRQVFDGWLSKIGVVLWQAVDDNLIARIDEAEREGWLGEVEGLHVSLARAEEKLAQVDRRPQNEAGVELGVPTIRNEGL